MTNTPQTDRLGIAKLEELFAKVGWYFREQFIKDFGIDAQVEIVESNMPTGAIIALQVKSGVSYFSEEQADCYIYRPDKRHVNYWLRHSLPVVIILYHPVDETLYWCPIIYKELEELETNYKIKVYKTHKLDSNNCMVLKKALRFPLHNYRINKLLLDLSWMKLIESGETVYAEFEDWVNKSLSRTSIHISCELSSGVKEMNIPTIYCAGMSSMEILEKYFPWADFDMDIEAYEENIEETYEEPEDIVPIHQDDEINYYRVIVKLNDIGVAFLKLSKYIFAEDEFELRSFSFEDVY